MTFEILGLVLTITFLNSILSLDNALANAAIAQNLPTHERAAAIRLGIILGLVFRLIALLFVGFILAFPLLRVAGALYLLFLAWDHFWGKEKSAREARTKEYFRAAVIAIGLTDIAFSIDNIIAAISLSTDIVLVGIGVAASAVVMMFATPTLELLMRRYRRLAALAFVIIAFIGVSIIADEIGNSFGLYVFHIGTALKVTIIFSLVALTIAYEELARFRVIP